MRQPAPISRNNFAGCGPLMCLIFMGMGLLFLGMGLIFLGLGLIFLSLGRARAFNESHSFF